MTWEWQVWRCFDNVRETFEEKGWEHGLDGRLDNEAMPLLAESGDLHVVFTREPPARASAGSSCATRRGGA